MKKILNVFITLIMFVIYLPLVPVTVLSVICSAFRATRAHKKIININNLGIAQIICVTLGADSYKEGEYDIYLLRDYSLCLAGGACVDILNKRVLIGYELVDEFEQDSNISATILLHEKGHVEAKYGNTTKKLWWNPEDWINQGTVVKASTLGEIAADRWALENGGDGEALIKFMKHHIWQCPISVMLRMHHIRKYMNAHK